MPVVEGSSEDIRNLMRLAYLTGCIIAPLDGVVLKEQSAFMILYRVFQRPLFFQASFKMRSLSKSLVFETNTIGHATPIPFFCFNLQITATQEQESEQLQQTLKNRQTVSHNQYCYTR